MAVLFREGLGGVHAAMASAYAAAQRAHEQSNSTAQQFMLALQDARRRDTPAVNVVVSGGQPPQPRRLRAPRPWRRCPPQPPNRGQLVPAAEPAPAVKRAQSRPADELAKRERKTQAGLAIAAASGAMAGPERPEEVPASSSAGPEYKTPERLAPMAAAREGTSTKAVARIAAAFPGVDARRLVGKVERGEVDAGTGPRQRRPRHERRQAHDPQPPRGGQPQSGLPRHRPQARQQPADPQGISKTPAKARARTRSERREVL
jgi:hypothetical protein